MRSTGHKLQCGKFQLDQKKIHKTTRQTLEHVAKKRCKIRILGGTLTHPGIPEPPTPNRPSGAEVPSDLNYYLILHCYGIGADKEKQLTEELLDVN